jgi:hypothetical protein
MSKDAHLFENSCIACQMGKSAWWCQVVPLSTIKELTWKPFQSVVEDSVMNLPTTLQGNKHIIVLVNYFSRWPVVIPVKDLSMVTWVKASLKEHFITVYGCPERLVSDCGGQFIGDSALSLYKYL